MKLLVKMKVVDKMPDKFLRNAEFVHTIRVVDTEEICLHAKVHLAHQRTGGTLLRNQDLLDVERLKDAHKAGDVAAIDSAIAALNQAWQTASAQMYQQSGAAGQPGGDTYQGGQQQAGGQQAGGNKADDIQDADFEEVK